MEKHLISVLTLNVWGLPGFLSTDRKERVYRIGKLLSERSYDIVCLQEVWCKDDYFAIKAEASKTLPYSHYYYSGVIGSGLCILSKWPLKKLFFVSWDVNGYFHMIHHGDWFGGKGVGFAQLNYKGIYNINVYNTHLIAKYSENDHYAAHRLIQAFDTATFIDLTMPSADLSIVCGDFNFTSECICYNLFTFVTKHNDAYYALNANGKEDVGTNEFHKNKYNRSTDNGIRIDYIFYKGSSNLECKALSYNLPYLKIPECDISYSDHEAVEAILQFRKHECLQENEECDGSKLLNEAIEICTIAENGVRSRSLYYFLVACILSLLLCYKVIPLTDGIFLLFLCSLSMVPLLYLIFMASVWRNMELNAIYATKTRLQNLLPKY